MSNELDFDPPVPKEPEKFPEVEDGHVIPRHWLRRFANNSDEIQVVLVHGGKTFKTSTRRAGTRRRPYSRTRPRGTRIDDIEWSLSTLEGPAAAPLREIENNWPLDLPQKATLAQLFGVQLVRGPRWMAWHEAFYRKQIEAHSARGGFVPRSGEDKTEQEIYEINKAALLSDTERLLRMNLLSAKVAAVFGSMTWTLLHLPTPGLALSDHPVSVWPIRDASRPPQPSEAGEIGLTNVLEVRVPVSPRLAVLMSWADRADDSQPVEIGKRVAKNLNSFTIAEAELEWFHLPDSRRPASGTGNWVSLAIELVNDYSRRQASRSWVRQEIRRRLTAQAGRGIESLDEHGRAIIELVVPPR